MKKKSSVVDTMDSETEKFLQLKARVADLEAANRDLENKVEAARGFPEDFRSLIRSAPTAWHLQKLVIDVITRLRYSCKASGRGVRDDQSNADLMGDPHYALARIVAHFNVSLTAKSTPSWLLKLKTNPAFQLGSKLWRKTKGSHEGVDKNKVIVLEEDDGSRLKVMFRNQKVIYVWRRDYEVIRSMVRERNSSRGVLLNWVGGILYEFDKRLDHHSAPLSKNLAERWSDGEKYLTHFLPFAEQRWNDEGIENIQISGAGLLRTNAGMVQTKVNIGRANDGMVKTRYGLRKTQPRQEFKDFVPDIKRLAKRQLKIWRDSIAGPVLK